MIPVISYIDNYTKIAINHDLEHSSITNCFLIVLYHVVQLRFDNSQYTSMLCYVRHSASVSGCQRLRLSKNDGLTRSGIRCFIAIHTYMATVCIKGLM